MKIPSQTVVVFYHAVLCFINESLFSQLVNANFKKTRI